MLWINQRKKKLFEFIIKKNIKKKKKNQCEKKIKK